MQARDLLLALLNAAAEKIGGTRPLARQMLWDVGGINDARSSKRSIGPYRALQLSQIVGEDPIPNILAALEAQASEADEKMAWNAFRNGKRLNSYELRKLVEDQIGAKYVFVVASALERAGLHDPSQASSALAKAKEFFDAWRGVFESGKSRIAIGDRRQLMADYLAGDEPGAKATAERWLELLGSND